MKPLGLTENGLRQCLRIAFGASIGFLVTTLFDLSYGVFFTVLPMLLLGLVPVINGHVARQLLAASVMCGVEVGIVAQLLGGHPVLMTMVAFLLFLYRFAFMARGTAFLFGANGVLMLSIMLHYASYPTTDVNNLIASNFFASLLAIAIAFMMHTLIPNKAEPSAPPVAPEKSSNRVRHEAILGATVTTLSFLVFQLFDLQDSISAQATTILVLFPMHWNGALTYARKRAMGTLIGVMFGLSVQLLLYDWYDALWLIVPLFWIGVMLFARLHVLEASGAGVGFGALTTLGILFGQYLSPTQDLVYSGLYRLSSTLVAIIAAMMVCYIVHKALNQFVATRFGS
ncbi:DUF2955 domain-containing protein [Idiomarina baltica]|uniref:Uncharacterized conserved membrane protein n=2 Tax=Idiomarina baltica TaxID=190892 RepID=A0ABM9WKF6_9GAMM|nr:DUF2955 domain-containing protein [Idiomarina baltica]EAQ31365.1 Uncharacterized conserved membrane protein [Idiomarina baltica OS145]MEC8924978.1 DUF2955 domain-containing protein [Pseudomonadota bacterium]